MGKKSVSVETDEATVMRDNPRSMAMQKNEFLNWYPSWFADTVTESKGAAKERERWQMKVADKSASKFQSYPLL